LSTTSAREIVVVDIETGGLDDDDCILEVAAINLTTGEEILFAPSLTDGAIHTASPDALRINRYYERGVYENELTDYATAEAYETLEAMLTGNTFAGSNPRFDSHFIAREIGQVWHHRLLDLSAYAAGVLAIDPTDLPSGFKVCELLGVANEDEHSALGDARATAECFRKLININKITASMREGLGLKVTDS